MATPDPPSLQDIVEQFDAVEIRNPDNPDRIVGRIGLVGTLYLPPNPDLAYRERLGALVDAFIERQSAAFQWRTEVLDEDKLRVRPLASGGRFAEAARRLGADAVFSGQAGASPAGADYPESIPSSHQIQFFLPGAKRPREAGHLRFNLPFAWERDTPGAGLLTVVRNLCTALSPLHGSAGMGFVYPPAYGDVFDAGVSGAFYPAAHRFPGIDATPPAVGMGELERLPTLNWLTAVSDALLERIGGVAAVRKALSGAFGFYDYPGGVLFQAGSAPLAGDREQRNIPLLYQQLYFALKGLMMDTVENPFVLDGVSDDEDAMYAAYARRFQ